MRRTTQNPRYRRAATRGFSILEILVAIIVIALPGISVMHGIIASSMSSGRARLRILAMEAVRGVADRIAATPIDEVYAKWGPGGTEGDTFSIPDLDGSLPAGRITIVVDETVTDATLGMTLGMPRDLDSDGAISNTNVTTGKPRILPVIVEAVWGPNEHFRLPVTVVRDPTGG